MAGERPALHDELHGEERHREGSDDEVGQGQREEEVVGDGLELLVYFEGDHHLHTACHNYPNPSLLSLTMMLPTMVRKEMRPATIAMRAAFI